MKSANFWYADGNVVIKAESTYYKLYRVRLAQYCVYFKKLFSHNSDNCNDRYTTVEGCAVYHLPAELVSDDFESLLAALETPLYVRSFAVSCFMVRADHDTAHLRMGHPHKLSRAPSSARPTA